jgi:hypothetical protein
MTNEHTSGPWRIEEGFDHETEESQGLAVYSADDDIICSLPGIGRHDFANAALIAAAPELLAALQQILAMSEESLGTFRKRGGTRRGLISVAAKAAIDKATWGEQ